MQFFYSPEIPLSGTFTLDADESRHCLRVLRKKIGDAIEAVDGKGNLFSAEIISDKGKLCELKITGHQKNWGRRNFSLTIAIAIPKNMERFEWFLEKATETGIEEIIPMVTEKTERAKMNAARMNKILISAMKQSGIALLPLLHEPKKFSEIVSTDFPAAQKFIAVCDWQSELKHLKNLYQKGSDALILIGPEGDFTHDEVQLAIRKNFQPVSLGKSRLRVETAGVVACAGIAWMNA